MSVHKIFVLFYFIQIMKQYKSIPEKYKQTSIKQKEVQPSSSVYLAITVNVNILRIN